MALTTSTVRGADGQLHEVLLDTITGQVYEVPGMKLFLGAVDANDGPVSSANPMPVSMSSQPLPSGAATEAKQVIGNALLEAIAGYLDTEIANILATLTARLPVALGAGGGLKVDGSGTALPVSGTVSATVSGVATAANQTGGNQKTQIVDDEGHVADLEQNVDGDWYVGTAMVQHVHADPNNSSTTNLGAPGYAFTGTSTSSLGVAGIQVSLFADKNCIVYVDQSPDGTNWDLTDRFFYDASASFGVTVQAISSYLRVRVTTMSETTTAFRLQTALCPVVEAVPRALDDNGHLKVSVKSDQFDNGPLRFSIQDDAIVTGRTRIIGAQFDGSTLDGRFWSNAVSTGTVAQSNGNVTITSGTASGHYARLWSNRRARYVTGEANSLRMNLRLPDAGTANVRRQWGFAWGATMPTVTDGAYFQLDGTTFSVVLLKGGNATTVSSGSFNGRWGYTLAPGLNNRTYRIQFNNATVKFIVDKKLLHTFSATAETWANTIHHHIWMEAYNSGNSAAVAMYCRNAGVHRHGPLFTAPTSYYQAGQTAGVVLKYGPGIAHGIVLSGVQNNSVITLYDNVAASGTVLWSSGSMGAVTAPNSLDLFDIPFSIGLTIVIATANSNAMVAYE